MELRVSSLEYLGDGHCPYNAKGKEKTNQILHGFVTNVFIRHHVSASLPFPV